jgi:hypothetical protein
MLVPALPVYTDGSYCPKTGAGGWAFMLPCRLPSGGYVWETFSGPCDVADNNAAERYAIEQACAQMVSSGMARGRPSSTGLCRHQPRYGEFAGRLDEGCWRKER